MTPHIEWLKGTEPVKGFVASYKDGLCRLVIAEIMREDSSLYVCNAKTEGGNAETEATLKVKGST